jgi:polar amino acid transport system substrate-binding protein
MSQVMASPDSRVADLVSAGKVRVALYIPNYTKDPVTGVLSGWAPDLVRALGDYLHIEGVPLEHPHPPAAMASLKSGAADAAIIGIVASRAVEIDYTAPLVEIDYTLMAPAGSPYFTIADADRPDVRIAAVRNHASTIALGQLIKNATFVYADTPDPTFELLRSGKADLFASVREVLTRCAA